jgi:hypothetical protein
MRHFLVLWAYEITVSGSILNGLYGADHGLVSGMKSFDRKPFHDVAVRLHLVKQKLILTKKGVTLVGNALNSTK